MIRLLGAITGSALALATLLVVVGIPQFKSVATDVERAIVTLPLPTSPVDPPQPDNSVATAANTIGEPVPDHAQASVLVDNTAPAESQPAATSSSEAQINETPSFDAQIADTTLTETQMTEAPMFETASPQLIDDAQSWYAFWSPFRSELAASGFIEQLQSVTGLDYRVVRIKPGIYEVAFAYQDDDDITANLTQITAATGLELPE